MNHHLRRLFSGALLLCVLLAGSVALASGYEAPSYRPLFGEESGYFLQTYVTPRTAVWVLAQLHLLFAAFVLAVPMFVLIIEIVGILQKDPAEAKRYDGLAYEFARLLTTAFSITAILGAVFTFLCIGLYPKFMSYLVDVFGPTMYLYSIIFFGEAFSLYLYYYGWHKIRGWKHVFLGVLLNVFGVTLMLIANAWTTFMMAPAGLDKDGVVVDRTAAFFNFLLHPINIHRLIANLCLGGAVAAAYAAYKFLSTKDPAKRAHYDWMGYIGNFIAILALLPLPFAGYYLGFEIYAYNQQLGIYMMGGVLSWMFILQAVLIGALFLAANYYLWLGMDRIEGSERYRGWIKWLLAVITVGVLVWATPNSLILNSSEIAAMGGTKHPILSMFGVMSAKNTAVNLIILSTFLSFILYRRGNLVATVPWAPTGKMIQVIAFAVAAAVVVVIGVGGYIPSMWLESTKRIGMSPYQVLAVLACMFVVMPIDVMMFRGAKQVGKINWGKVSDRSQYALIFLAVTFTWTMGLMGFVRSSLRQHWHVYEVVKDTSPEAFTPAIGHVTIVVTAVVILFFALVAFVVAIANLGAHEHEHEVAHAHAPAAWHVRWGRRAAWGVALVAVYALVSAGLSYRKQKELDRTEVTAVQSKANKLLNRYEVADKDKGTFQVPIDRAMQMLVAEPACAAPPGSPEAASCTYWQDPAAAAKPKK